MADSEQVFNSPSFRQDVCKNKSSTIVEINIMIGNEVLKHDVLFWNRKIDW